MIQIQTLSLSVSSQFSHKHAHTHTHTHTPLCTRLHHQSTALLSKLFDPQSRVLSAVPLSEFQRFWDNSNVSRHILGPPRRQRRGWKMPPRSLSLHCPYSLIRPSLWLALPPWCVVSAWENAGLSGCYVLRRRPQGPRGVLLEPSVPAVGLTVANTHNE